MSAHPKVGLDNAVFSERIRRRKVSVRRGTPPPIIIMDGGLQKNRPHKTHKAKTARSQPKPQSISVVEPQPYAVPAVSRQQRSKVLKRQSY